MPPLTVGWTPLYRADRLGAGLGLKHVWVKDEGRQPSASFKDRASVVAVVKAQERGAEVITTASTATRARRFRPCAPAWPEKRHLPARDRAARQSRPTAGLRQHGDHGPRHLRRHVELCAQAAKEFGWYNRNTGYNPYMSEGKKTVSFEVCEQFTAQVGAGLVGAERPLRDMPQNPPLQWDTPDRIFVSVGDGCIIGGVHKGLRDLMALGWIKKMPQIHGRAGCRLGRIIRRVADGHRAMEMQPIDAHTIADSISAGLPADRIKGLAAVRDTGGAYIKVTDEEILAAIPTLARGCGVFAEPAGAAAYVGLVKAVELGLVHPDERIVLLSTGNGLKDIASSAQERGRADGGG